MAQASIASEVIDRVTGHVTAGETARYTKQFRIEQPKAAIISTSNDSRNLCHTYTGAIVYWTTVSWGSQRGITIPYEA